MKIVVTPKLLKFLTGNFARAMAIFPFILLRDKKMRKNKTLINHEKIHLRQQLEMLVLPFYIWYGIEYIIRRIQFKTHYHAYRHISFEREAYSNEHEQDYLSERRFWGFLKYI